jgi:predicted phosphodiesterase
MIAFIHLSDIHFTSNSGDRYDVDNDLRKELLFDISGNLKTHIKEINGILVCGDIAFSGKPEEYTTANDFLNQVCEALSLSESRVYCVPGNHDINQEIPKKSMATKLLQDYLEKQKDIYGFDSCLGKICRDPQSARALFEPIDMYNSSFAGKYGCALSENLSTSHIIPISESYNLCIMGINSTLISNSDDHLNPSRERLMKLGQLQIPPRQKDTINLTLCHHPPECWFDPEKKLQQKMNNRVHIQLYGHKHLQTVKKVDNSLIIGRERLIHPDRNWIGFHVIIGLQLNCAMMGVTST